MSSGDDVVLVDESSVPSGHVSPVRATGNEWAFTVTTEQGAPMGAFVFRTETEAKHYAQVVKDIVRHALAITMADSDDDRFLSVPVLSS